ncbi:kinesin-like protein [Elysia marginata]|uniref:Kinesin-like protein n=1 Tax=Elysia marginata TaxID=1093978 RepID=A0AAV4G7B9_9GAST|nr:kinesin-like protein [Elysia marginata]
MCSIAAYLVFYAFRSPVAGNKPSSSPSHSAKGERKAESPTTPAEREPRPDKDVDGSTSPVSSAGNISRQEKTQRPRLQEDMESPPENIDQTGRPSIFKVPPDTPPNRTAAFEEFKTDRGSEINRILIENKEILASKKKLYSELAGQINGTKNSIDHTRQTLEKLRIQREADGPILNEDGDIIISEEEFLEIQRLKDLKSNYRTKYDELHNLKSEVSYCQKLVDQCRLRLIQEFDNWYSESFLASSEDNQTSLGVGHGVRPGVVVPITSLATEDEQEKFERLQLELMMNNPESAAFYNAQMRTSRRVRY